MCLKVHCPNLHVPLRSVFTPNSVGAARYAAFICNKSLTKCNATLKQSVLDTSW
ncbi:DUF6783 domain-containing protein [Lacrimispora aerotolerans]|uniref:DUF6783 domain-containing protein n=1 Tax=Lacrimispora aerotolerans TaxID=36832 RepID=UPI002FE534F0